MSLVGTMFDKIIEEKFKFSTQGALASMDAKITAAAILTLAEVLQVFEADIGDIRDEISAISRKLEEIDIGD